MLSRSLLVASSAALVFAAPSLQSLGTDLNLLFQTNLNWTEAPWHQGAILIDAANYSAAASTCSQLSESLLVPNSSYFVADFANALAYLQYANLSSFNERFWISQDDNECRTVGVAGTIFPVACSATYRALCSQSAPYGVPSTTQNVASDIEVTVQAGDFSITGFRNQASFRFYGIPYANEPERYTYSTLYNGTSNITATAFGDACIQPGRGSENCLFLNIWTPYLPSSANPSKHKLKPVHFWIHGGAYKDGAGSDYDGGPQVARGDVVVVSINYRLNTLGFMALPGGLLNGNFGIADQIVALEWVQKYITAFGGDPDRVTIAGQSAGAGSVRALLASPVANGKFQAALPQSNLDGMLYAATYSNYYTTDQWMTVGGYAILNSTGCNTTAPSDPATLACLRQANATAMANNPNPARFVVVDGTYITTPQLEVDGSGPVANVHLMIGWMHDDGNSFIKYLQNVTLENATTTQITMSNASTKAIEDSGLFPYYNSGNTTLDIFNVTARMATDVEFRCLDRATAAALVKHKLMKSVWVYQFNRGYGGYDPNLVCNAPVDAEHPNGNPDLPHFHCHSGELQYTFGTIGSNGTPFRDGNDLYFQQQIVDQWTSFFRSYNPNPDPYYLAVRGYADTALEALADGPWEPLTDPSNPTIRLLSVPSIQSPFTELPQCDYFGYTVDYYG